MNILPDKQNYADLIRQLIPINELPQDVQNQIIVKGDIFELKKKDLVFNQGDRDNYSFYLLDGEIELEANKQVHNSIVGKTDRARYPMAQLQPRQFSGKARVASVVLRLDRDVLDKLLVMHQSKAEPDDGLGEGAGILELDEIDGVNDEGDWMTRMLQSEIFSGMPTANIHQLFSLLQPVDYKTGDSVIKQGEPGNHYYIIQEGRCEVLRQSMPGGKAIRLAELHPGDSFGEEALIAETTRNATVRMLTDGIVAQLSKDNFVTLIQKPVLKAVSSDRAGEIVKAGGKWLDVRFKNEYDRNTIEGCVHIPMNILRLKLDTLDRDIHYVLFCDTGGRSSTAAFLLTDRGFTASYLESGLVNHPELAPPEDVTQTPKVPVAPPPTAAPKPAPSAAPKPAPRPATAAPAVKPSVSGQVAATPKPAAKPEVQAPAKPESVPAVKPQTPPAPQAAARVESVPRPAPAKVEAAPVEADDDDGEMDPEIMATVLEAELTRTNFQIERARQQDQSEQKNIETARRLEQERAKIEEAKLRVEEDVRRLRLEEEARLKKMEQEAAQRLELERRKIEEVYTRNAEEMEKLERLKHEAEENLRLEKERIEREAEEARRNRQDVEKIRQELEAARKAMELEAERRRLEQDEMRKKIESDARQKIEIERRKIAVQIARNNQEMEKAKQEKAIAEAGRVAARQEAELMIQEYKSQHEKSRADEEERIRAERLKLEEEQRSIQKALQEIQKTRAEAEALKRAALAEVSALKARQFQEDITRSEVARNELKDKIKQAQDKLVRASEKVAKVEQDEEQAVVARKVNEEDLQKKKAEEEALRKQLEADLSEFKEELEVQEREYANATTQLEHMRRIKERAEAAKKAAEDASHNLLSDVASQLGDKKP
jgi:CRP-like cAMP-binding protein